MAVSFVNASSASSISTSTISTDKPTGTVESDVLVAVLSIRGDANVLAAPTGWTLAYNVVTAASSAGIRQAVYYKVAGASEPSSYEWTLTLSRQVVLSILGYRGASTTTPVDVTASTSDTTGGNTSIVSPSVTASGPGMLLTIASVNAFVAAASFTPPSGMTERVDAGVDNAEHCISELAISGGATGSRTTTCSDNTDDDIGGTLVLLEGNAAPNAPTLTAPIGGATVDRTADILLQGTFSDPDAGDELSEVTVEYRPVSGSTTSDTEPASGSTFTYTIPGGTLSAGNYEWRAKTKDAAGAEGPFSAWASFTAGDAPAAPVITDPADLGTVNTDPYTVTWTAPNQEAYQVRTVADSGGTPDTGTVYEDTGTVVSATRSASIDFPTNSRTEHVQVRVRFSGLWSAYDSHQVSVSYTAPPTPTATVTADNTDGSIDVAVSNPTPSGSEPDVESNQVQRQQSLDSGSSWTDEDGTVDAFNTVGIVAEDATYTDRQVAHLVLYRYRAKTIGDNGTNVTGAWTT